MFMCMDLTNAKSGGMKGGVHGRKGEVTEVVDVAPWRTEQR